MWGRTEALAWAAGLFEGEGYVGLSSKGSSRALSGLRACLWMSDGDVVERFHDVIDLGHRRYRKRQPNKDLFGWETNGSEAVIAVSLLRPFLGDRRGARVDECIAWYRQHFVRMCPGCGRQTVFTKSHAQYCSTRCGQRGRRGVVTQDALGELVLSEQALWGEHKAALLSAVQL